MNQTQPNTRTVIGLIIGAIVLVAGLLLISNAGRSGDETPPPSPTRVSQQPTATPQPEASPTPAAQTRNDEEDPDGDGFIGEADFCPDVAGAFDGCPDSDNDGIPDDKDTCPTEGDLGYGIDGVGCPNPPTDRDGDGIFDNEDTCPDNGDEGNGIDSVGCPIPPPPQPTPDEPQVLVPDSAPAIMPYRFENVGPEDNCSVQIVNVGDGDPATFSDAIPVTPDENGVVQGEMSILLGANDVPEAVIMCIGTAPLPPAIAAFEYSFEIPPDLNCTILITDADGNVVESFPAVPDENGFASGIFEYDPGVIISPVAQIGCVPNVAPAVMPYEFTGLSDVICTVTIVNVGDGNPADFGSAGGLIPDQNGTISGFISILVGAGDVPEAVIGCVPASAPAMIAYEYDNISPDAICTVTVMNVGDGDPADLGSVDGLVADENGIISGAIAIIIGDGDVPELDLSCLLTIPVEATATVGTAIAAQTFTFSAPDDFPPDVAFCDVVVNDGNMNSLETFSNLVPNENGVIEVLYEYEPGTVLEPLSAFIVCAIADDFGNPEVTPIVPPSVDYNLSADFQCLPIPDDARSFVQVGISVTATGNYRQSYQMTWVSGDTTIQNAIGLNLETGSLAFNMPLGTGQASGTLTLVAYDETASLVPAETWIFDAPPCAETAYVLSASPWCQRNEQGGLVYLGVLVTGSGNYPLNYQTTWVSGDYTYGPVTSVWNSTLPTFNLAYEPGAGMTTGTLTLVPYSTSYDLLTDLTIVYDLDCTPEPEVTPEPELTPDPEETPDPNGELPDVYAVYFTKDWYANPFGGGLGAPALGYGTGPSDPIDNLIVATSVLGRAECDWTGSYLECSYFALIDGQPQPVEDLYIPVGDSYVVEEAPVEGWVVGQGTGTFTYDQCLASNIRVGRPPNPNFDVVGYCNHHVINVIPNTESVMVVEIDKIWMVGNTYGGLDAPAEGGGYYGPNYDILGLIVATSDYGTLTCDWLAVTDGGYLSCHMQFTSRPPWYDEFDDLPVPAGGSYTVTENVPDGWTLLRGTGTFTIDNCTDSYTYTEYYEVDGEEFMVAVTECWHDVVNQSEFIDTEDFYGVQIDKIWAEEIETAMQNRGLNSPALGGGSGPSGYYYPLIRAFSNYGEAWCDWYANYGLECYYNSYPTAPFPAYDYLLVKRGESFTVIEVPINGYINTRGVGTFDESSCNFVGELPAGRGYEGGYIELPICRHEVENIAFETEDYYRVVLEKDWYYNPDAGLNAPAQGGAYKPYYNIPNFITIESSIGIGTCSWIVANYDGNLVCQFSAKDGQFMPDNSALWVPVGEGYTVTETPPDGWEASRGVGTFSQCPSYFDGVTCYHRVDNTSSQLPAYRVYIAKFWQNFLCDDYGEQYEDDCYFGTASANSGLNAPLSGGFYSPGPDVFIRDIITVTSDLGTLSCNWVPRYYDAYYGVTIGELDCRITSIAQGYPPYYGGLWVPAGGSYTVTENLPSGYYTVYGTGTFNLDECLEQGFYDGVGSANFVPVGGKYYEDGDECLHVVMNDRQEIEPTPEVTPTEEFTPIVTPTEEITPIVTPTEEFTPEVTEVPSEEPTPVTPETPVTPTEEPSPEPTPEGVCGDYALASDGFPIISLSNAPCGDDSEGAVVNFSPIQTGGAVCIAEALYHSNGGGTWDIWRTADGMEAENLTNNPAGIISMAPTRSPNGRYVAYASNADGDWEIYLIDLDNLDAPPMQLTNNTQSIDLDPVFSPSGRLIAYESNVDGNWEIRLIDLTTGEKRRVTSHPANDINPFWHPDGSSLLFQSDRTGKWQIFSATTIAGTSTASLISDGVGDDFDPTYSPNGERIAFRSERNGEMGIYIMDADGSDVRKVSLDGYSASTPVWDSGNRYIAYQASKAGESLNDIFVYDTVTGETRQLTSSVGDMANVQDVAPTWLCNSTTVIFASDVSGNNRLYALNALPMSAPPVDLTGMGSWTENDFNNRDPQNTPSEENGSRMGALPPRR